MTADFYFGFVEDRPQSTPSEIKYANIKIGEFTEYFPVDLNYWDEEKYNTEWKYRLNRCISGKVHF